MSPIETTILAILEFLGVCISIYGLWFQYVMNVSLTGILYCSVWYVLCGVSQLLGVISIILEQTEDPLKGNFQSVLQYHYLLAWLAVVIGYPLMVTYSWITYYPSVLGQLHISLAIIPLVAWIAHSGNGIVKTTQLCTGLAALSQGYIAYLAGDFWGICTAHVMAVNIVALSLPTRFHLWEFSSRELFIIGLVVTSWFMNTSITEMPKRRQVRSLNPF
ncbi:hypothetical protein Ocin01_06839 [Orchesella cincta]|uniref:Uncharacterized protein n=1 Tax=Orchesella cincta TaxID=48709 RepID=A0A1D2N3J3_ORCCI|nr:hypothetical protein Ocin01_06839 [Orchesella cincta]